MNLLGKPLALGTASGTGAEEEFSFWDWIAEMEAERIARGEAPSKPVSGFIDKDANSMDMLDSSGLSGLQSLLNPFMNREGARRASNKRDYAPPSQATNPYLKSLLGG